MFTLLIPNSYELVTPAISDTTTTELELVRAFDVSGYRKGMLLLRQHSGAVNLEIALRAYKVWPGETADPVFQDEAEDPIAYTNFAVGLADNGKLVTNTTPSDLYSPALRVFIALKANGGAIAAGTRIIISAGISLFAD